MEVAQLDRAVLQTDLAVQRHRPSGNNAPLHLSPDTARRDDGSGFSTHATRCTALVSKRGRRYFQRRISRLARHHATNDREMVAVTAIESFNKVVDLARDLGDPGLKRALMEFRDELKALIVENQRLRDRHDALLAQLQQKGMAPVPTRSVKFERGAYWLVDDDGILRGPMCRKCWESKQELHRCNQQMQYFFMCPECGSVARLPGVKPA